MVEPGRFFDQNIPTEVGYALHNNLLSQVSTPRGTSFTPRIFKEVKPTITCTNQKSSGRCWIFAALNMLRRDLMTKKKLPPNFQFSQSYMFFWDKLERMNYNLKLVKKWLSSGKDINSREVQHILKEPFGDGGQWVMFANLVNKYGVVPQDAYPESTHSSASTGVNLVLSRMFRNFVLQLWEDKLDIDDSLSKTYEVLVRFFGVPPRDFVWEYKEESGAIIQIKTTPQRFAKDICGMDMSQYVSLTHDPRNDYMKLYGVDGLGNVEGGQEVKYLNVPIQRMRDITKECIDANQPVWFGSDVGQFFKSKDGVLDETHFDYLGYLGIVDHMSKLDRIVLCESLMTHAMVYDGYHKDSYGNVDYWKIENSWGADGPYNGHLVCSDNWFREYTYQLIVPRRFVNDEELAAWNGEISKHFPLWDPMGSLAL